MRKLSRELLCTKETNFQFPFGFPPSPSVYQLSTPHIPSHTHIYISNELCASEAARATIAAWLSSLSLRVYPNDGGVDNAACAPMLFQREFALSRALSLPIYLHTLALSLSLSRYTAAQPSYSRIREFRRPQKKTSHSLSSSNFPARARTRASERALSISRRLQAAAGKWTATARFDEIIIAFTDFPSSCLSLAPLVSIRATKCRRGDGVYIMKSGSGFIKFAPHPFPLYIRILLWRWGIWIGGSCGWVLVCPTLTTVCYFSNIWESDDLSYQ